MERIKHLRIKLIFIFASVVVLSLSIYSYLRINSLMKSATEVNHTNVVKFELESMFSEIKDAESSYRGYILTDNKTFLNQFNLSVLRVKQRMQTLENLTHDNYSQRINCQKLDVLVWKRIDYMRSISKRSDSNTVTAQRWLVGRSLMDDLREHVDKMMNEEDFLLRLRTNSLTKESSLTPVITVFLIICSILVLIFSYYGINLELKISNTLRYELEKHKRDLLEANESLQKSNQENVLSRYNKRFITEFSEKFSNYKVHNEFFNSLVQYIADLTHLDYILVGKLDHENEIQVVHTMAVTAFGKLIDNFTYPLPDGPCEQVVMNGNYSYPENCQKLFPLNQTLKDLNADAYLGYPLLDSDGQPMGLIAVLHQKPIEDTETLESILRIVAKRAEMELERIKNEEILEKKNISLEEKNQSLAKMNKELESFTYISSHDLQEPLRKIQTFLSRIMDTESEKLSDNGRNYLIRTHEAANRMQNLIRDLLAYSRLNEEIFPTQKADLFKIVELVKSDLDEEIRDKKVTIEVKGKTDVTIIESQFHQLLTNLISNSIKFAKPDTPSHIIIENKEMKGADIDIEHVDPQKTYSKITVTDNGIGFSSEYKNRIFEVFQRLHTIKEYPGTGIGLAIVKKIVDNHHGFITADSEQGKGAVFTVFLPV